MRKTDEGRGREKFIRKWSEMADERLVIVIGWIGRDEPTMSRVLP
jgi:hypothetical protein